MIISAGKIKEISARFAHAHALRGAVFVCLFRAVFCDAWHFHKIRYLFGNIFLTQLKMYVQNIKGLGHDALNCLFTNITGSGTLGPFNSCGHWACGVHRFLSIRFEANAEREKSMVI